MECDRVATVDDHQKIRENSFSSWWTLKSEMIERRRSETDLNLLKNDGDSISLYDFYGLGNQIWWIDWVTWWRLPTPTIQCVVRESREGCWGRLKIPTAQDTRPVIFEFSSLENSHTQRTADTPVSDCAHIVLFGKKSPADSSSPDQISDPYTAPLNLLRNVDWHNDTMITCRLFYQCIYIVCTHTHGTTRQKKRPTHGIPRRLLASEQKNPSIFIHLSSGDGYHSGFRNEFFKETT